MYIFSHHYITRVAHPSSGLLVLFGAFIYIKPLSEVRLDVGTIPLKQSPNQPPGVSGLVVHHSISGPSPAWKQGCLAEPITQTNVLSFPPQKTKKLRDNGRGANPKGHRPIHNDQTNTLEAWSHVNQCARIWWNIMKYQIQELTSCVELFKSSSILAPLKSTLFFPSRSLRIYILESSTTSCDATNRWLPRLPNSTINTWMRTLGISACGAASNLNRFVAHKC